MRTSLQPIMLAALALATTATWAEEPASQPGRELTFVEGEEKWDPLKGADFSSGPQPEYVTQLSIVGQRVDVDTADVLQTPAASALSEAQRTFMAKSPWKYYGEMKFQPPEGDLIPGCVFGIYTVSAEDARNIVTPMLEALEKALDKQRQDSLNALQANVNKAQEEVSEQEKRIAELQEELPKLQVAAGAAQPYKLDTVARDDMRELEKMRFGVDVEVAGIRARQQATQTCLEKGDPVTCDVLRRMLVEQSIELAGALARREAVETRRRFAELSVELFMRPRDLCTARDQREHFQSRLEAQRADVGPITVRRNTVQIYRLD
jgi:hypothetical protein